MCPQKKNKKGREEAFSSQTSIILKLTYLGCGSSDFDEIWHTDAVSSSWPFGPLKISNFKNPRWRRPPSWRIEKSPYLGCGSSDLDKIWRGYAVRPSWPFWTLKISYFENPRSKIAAAAILKIEKSPYLGRGSSDFYEMWHTDAFITTCPGIDIALEEGFD